MKKQISLVAVVFILLGALAGTANADHRWGNYHWARTSNPFTLKLGDNVTAQWDAILAAASADWTASTVLDTTVVTGLSNPKTCKPILGRIEVCNSKYGNNGWLGIAQIWASGNHITQGVTKLNDTYFNTAKYNTTAWKNLVTCQEVGHTFGLDHQDEDFSNGNLGTCMDYTNDPFSNQHPNAHDYEELVEMYSHLDSTTTVSQTTASKNQGGEVSDLKSTWGKVVHTDGAGRDSVFLRDLGGGHQVLTHVFWAE